MQVLASVMRSEPMCLKDPEPAGKDFTWRTLRKDGELRSISSRAWEFGWFSGYDDEIAAVAATSSARV